MTFRPSEPPFAAGPARGGPGARARGALKVFFGAGPGVGKTFRMLAAARARRAEGVDVLVGHVDVRGRPETAALLAGLEALPPRDGGRGGGPGEFDLDGALARRPGLLVLDDLAHDNAPGARHARRWQDALELLEAGVDVYATVDVGHVESLRDVVARIAGARPRGAVPDAVLDRADEVELVDLPADELWRRRREGGGADAPAGALDRGALLALRGLALRRVADRVDEQLRGHMRGRGVDGAGPAGAERVLVCVGPSPMSARLVRAAKRMAASLRAEWFAVSVETPGGAAPAADARARVHEHLRLAESLGAQTATLSGARVADEVVAFGRRHRITKIVVGKPTHPRWRDALFGSLVDEIIRASGDADVHVITGDAAGGERPAPGPAGRAAAGARAAAEYAWALAAVVAASLVGALMAPAFERADIVMAFLLAVVLVSFRLRRGPSAAAAALSIAAFDFFFVPPYYTFAVRDARHVVTFGTMMLVALVVSGLAHRVRGQARAAREREQRTAALYAASRDFAGTTGLGAIAAAAARHVGAVFGGEALVLLPGEGGELAPRAGPAPPAPLAGPERAAARWAFEHGRPAGRGTGTLADAGATYAPLRASRGVVGVLAVRAPGPPPPADPGQRRLLEAFASQSALALERALLVDEAQRAQLAVERERALNALLSSVSHDLRTPLASITGSASTLLAGGPSLSAAMRTDLAETVYEEAARLDRLVANLLDMTRLAAGVVAAKKEWQPLEEVVGSALARLDARLAGRPVEVRLPGDLPMVPVDAVLLEQVLLNLLENVLKYTPAGSPVALAASARGGEVTVRVDDEGPGVPPADAERVFDSFYRGGATGAGAGLGLAICRGVVAAHGGRIWVEPAPGRGASFRFTLPLDGGPPPLAPAATPPDPGP